MGTGLAHITALSSTGTLSHTVTPWFKSPVLRQLPANVLGKGAEDGPAPLGGPGTLGARVRGALTASCLCSLELSGGGDSAVPHPEDQQPRASQLLRVQRQAQEKPAAALHLPSCLW